MRRRILPFCLAFFFIETLKGKFMTKRERRAQLLAQAAVIDALSHGDGPPLTEEQMAEFEGLLAQADALTLEIDQTSRQEAAHARLTAGQAVGSTPQAVSSLEIPTEARIEVRDNREDHPYYGFSGFGEYAAALATGVKGGAIDERLYVAAAASGLNQAIDSDGGALVAPRFSTEIWDGLNTDVDNLLPMTDSFTIEGESLTFAANAETSRVDGSRYGGIQGFWINEADQITSSKPKLRKLKLEPQQLAILVFVTDKLLSSPTTLTQFLTRASTEEIAFRTGDAIINGDGSGKPLGLLNSNALIVVAKETSQAADTVNQPNILKMWSRLHVRCRANAVWLINTDVEQQLWNMFHAVRNVADTENVGGFQASVFNATNMTLMGRPIIVSEFAQTLGDEGDIILTDLNKYATGIKGGVDEAVSIHLRFDFAETAFRFMFAVDGQTWLNSPLTPFNGTQTQSSVVTLAVRA